MLNVICLKVGDKYSSEYVNKLYNMVRRHMSLPFRFVCFTDNSVGINKNIECLPPLTDNPYIRGWFYKLSFFQDEIYDLRGEVLFLDLDIVIINDITELFNYDTKFCVISDWLYGSKSTTKFNSSVMKWSVGDLGWVFSDYVNNYRINKKFTGDQDYLSKVVSDYTFWPVEWCVSYKFNQLSEKNKIVVFHGNPNPHECLNLEWVKTNWI